MSVLELPMRLYIITDTVMATTYGNPCAKYKVGIHAHGEVLFLFMLCFQLRIRWDRSRPVQNEEKEFNSLRIHWE